MTSAKAVATLVIFIISIAFVIRRDLPVYIPYVGRKTIRLHLTAAPIVAILILWAAQCLDTTDIRNGIVGTAGVKPYNILILFFSLAYMSITLDVTGILQAAAYWVSNRGGNSGWKLFLYFYIMLTLISIVVGNDPVILSGTAFLVYYTRAVDELEPLPWLISEFAAANTASMVLFLGNPTNVVICEGFGVRNAAFTAYTILPFLACSVGCFIALAVQYRSAKHLPRQITATELKPRSVLLDPVSACFGSLLLGSCLVVILVVSFFKPSIDVWMIILPFAVVKFFYDLAWDNYRYINGWPMLGRGQTDPEELIPAEKSQASTGEVPQSSMSQVLNHRHVTRLPPSVVPTNSAPIPHPDPTSDNSEPLPEHVFSTEQNSSPTSTTSFQRRFKEGSLTIYIRVKERFPIFFKVLPRLPSPTTTPSEDATPPMLQVSTQPHVTHILPNDIPTNDAPILQPDPIPDNNEHSLPKHNSPTEQTTIRTSIPSPHRHVRERLPIFYDKVKERFPTFFKALPRLPFALVPFAFSQFILIEALTHQGWIDVFATWLVRATHRQIYPTIWVVGVFGVILCNISGTNIGATILLTKVVRAANMPSHTLRAAAIALAVASNIGAVSFTFSASLAGLLWKSILDQKKISCKQREFAKWNALPLTVMTAVGLSVVSAEMAVLYGGAMS